VVVTAAKYGGGGGERSQKTTMLQGGGGRLELVISSSASGRDGCVDDDSELERLRHRNASGSLSSHCDYDDNMSTSSASLRSTPTCGPPHLAHSPRLLAIDLTEGKRKRTYSSSQHASPLRELTCHMGSHGDTCHPAEVTFPPFPQPKLVFH